MSALRGRTLRWLIAPVVLVVGRVDVQALLHTLGRQERRRQRAIRSAWQSVWSVRPQLQADLRDLETPTPAVADTLLRETLAQEFEVFEADGRRVFSHPD